MSYALVLLTHLVSVVIGLVAGLFTGALSGLAPNLNNLTSNDSNPQQAREIFVPT